MSEIRVNRLRQLRGILGPVRGETQVIKVSDKQVITVKK